MLINTLFNALLMSYGLLPTSPRWQLKLCRKFDSKLPSTGRVIWHLCRDPVAFSHWGIVDPVNPREMLANCFHKCCGEPPEEKNNKTKHAKLEALCIITEANTELKSWCRSAVAILLRWEEHMAHANVGEGEWDVDPAELSALHH